MLGLRDCRSDIPLHFADQRELFVHRAAHAGLHSARDTKMSRTVRRRRARWRSTTGSSHSRAHFSTGRRRAARACCKRADGACERRARVRAGGHVPRTSCRGSRQLREQFDRLRFAVESLSFVYDVKGCDGRDRSYVIRRGVVRAEVDTPRSRKQRTALQKVVDDIFGETPPKGSSIPTHEIDELLLLSSWFRKFPAEMERARRVA